VRVLIPLSQHLVGGSVQVNGRHRNGWFVGHCGWCGWCG
jgi:hypothetical protein